MLNAGILGQESLFCPRILTPPSELTAIQCRTTCEQRSIYTFQRLNLTAKSGSTHRIHTQSFAPTMAKFNPDRLPSVTTSSLLVPLGSMPLHLLQGCLSRDALHSASVFVSPAPSSKLREGGLKSGEHKLHSLRNDPL
jgi:hypothetical protein